MSWERTDGGRWRGSLWDRQLKGCFARASGKQMESPFDVPFHRVLYATDLSETSIAALHYCADLARVLGASVTMLHVLDLHGAVAFDSEADIHALLMGRMHKTVGKENCDADLPAQ